MSDRTAVMVTGVGACGVGEGVAKALRMAGRYDVVAVNADPNAPELFEVEHRYLVPRASEEGYVEALVKVSKRHGVRVILPGSEPETVVLAAAREFLLGEGIIALTNPSHVVHTCQDKWLTFQHLSEAGIPTPLTLLPNEDREFSERLGFPMILKPRAGHASQDVFLVHAEDELPALLNHFDRRGSQPVAQQYIPGAEEFTCSALLGNGGELLGSIAMRRSLMGGFSQKVEVEAFPEASAITEEVAHSLHARGPVNVQCRLWNGQFWVFEINARFSGSAPFRAAVGFNEPDILIQHALNPESLQPPAIRFGVVGMRRLEEVIVTAQEYRGIQLVGGPPRSPASGGG